MSEIKRLRYEYGQFLQAEDFTEEQEYHIRMRRLHNSRLYGFGVLEGLSVKLVENGKVSVEPGMAIDLHGREIVLTSTDDKSEIPNPRDKDQYLVTISHHEFVSESPEKKRTIEQPQVNVFKKEASSLISVTDNTSFDERIHIPLAWVVFWTRYEQLIYEILPALSSSPIKRIAAGQVLWLHSSYPFRFTKFINSFIERLDDNAPTKESKDFELVGIDMRDRLIRIRGCIRGESLEVSIRPTPQKVEALVTMARFNNNTADEVWIRYQLGEEKGENLNYPGFECTGYGGDNDHPAERYKLKLTFDPNKLLCKVEGYMPPHVDQSQGRIKTRAKTGGVRIILEMASDIPF